VLRVVTRLWRSSPRHAALLLAAGFAGLVLVLSGATDSAASEGDQHDHQGWSGEAPEQHHRSDDQGGQRWSEDHWSDDGGDGDADADADDAVALNGGPHDDARRGDLDQADTDQADAEQTHRERRGGTRQRAAAHHRDRHLAPAPPAPPVSVPAAPPSNEPERLAPEPATPEVEGPSDPAELAAPSIDVSAAPAEPPAAEAALPDTSPRPIAHPSLPDGGGEDGALHTTPVSNPAAAAVLFLHEGPLGAPIARLAVHEPAVDRPIFYVSNRVPG
jgi:hypothetical protein